MRTHSKRYSIWTTVAVFLLAFAPTALPQTAERSEGAKNQNALSPQDLSGVWAVSAPRGVPWYNYALTGDEPPMTPWAEAQFKANKPSFGPHPQEHPNDLAYGCFPPGVPRVYAAVQAAMQIVQLPGRVIMIFGRNVRQVYTDGRSHPAKLKPLWMGHSIGRWDGDTFVIDTIGISDRTWLDRMGHPHSDALHLVERFRRVSRDTLNLEMTIDDPKAYTKTWAAQRTFRLRPPTSELGEGVCEDMFINEAFGLEPMRPSTK
jgi:hypothetical protein